MSRALHAALAALLVASGSTASAQPAPVPQAAASDAAILAVASPWLKGSVLATTRAALPNGDAALLVAIRSGRANVAYVMTVIGKGETGELALLARDELPAIAAAGPPTVALSVGALPFTAGAIVASVGWKGADGTTEERQVLYRYGDRKLSSLLQLPAVRRHPPGVRRPSELREIELLPTGSAGYRDLLVRTRSVDCVAEGDCAESSEVVSYAFDGVRYSARPHAIPFVETIAASSMLAERGRLTDRSAGAAIDGRIETAWCEGAKGAGWFEKLELAFLPAQRVRAVTILPGLGSGEDFAERTRPKRIRVLLPDGRKVEGDLADEPKAQRIAIPEGERVFGMTVVIVDVNKGRLEDACIGELGVEVEP